MRIAIISDIHSNLSALTMVIKKCREMNVELYLVIGDIVGYYTKPNEVCALLQEEHTCIVAGNHDINCVSGVFADRFSSDFLESITEQFMEAGNLDALEALGWTMANMNPEIARFLMQDTYRRIEVEGLGIVMVHGMPPEIRGEMADAVGGYLTPSRIQEFRTELYNHLVKEKATFMFTGHTHIPAFENVAPEGETPRYIVNAGSVGQPRSGEPRTSFMTLEIENGVAVDIQQHLEEYMIEDVQEGIKRAGLPESLATRLEKGL